MSTVLVTETINNAAGSVIQKSLTVTLDLLICVRSSVQCFDVFVVEADGGGSVLDDLVPV